MKIWTAALLVCCTALAEGGTVNERVAISPDGALELSIIAGSVELKSWGKNEIELRGEYGAGIERIELTVDGDVARIKEVRRKKDRGRVDADDGSADLELRVPERLRVSITTVSADIVSENLAGPQRLQSVSGDIDVERAGNEIDVQSISGDIEVAGRGGVGRVLTSSVSGDVRIRDVSGEVEAKTISGEVEVEADTLDRVRVDATSGDLRILGKLARGARVDLRTASGDIDLSLCGKIDAEFDLTTFSGDIEDVFGHEAESARRLGPGRGLRATVGGGSARVTANTMSGDIEVEGC